MKNLSLVTDINSIDDVLLVMDIMTRNLVTKFPENAKDLLGLESTKEVQDLLRDLQFSHIVTSSSTFHDFIKSQEDHCKLYTKIFKDLSFDLLIKFQGMNPYEDNNLTSEQELNYFKLMGELDSTSSGILIKNKYFEMMEECSTPTIVTKVETLDDLTKVMINIENKIDGHESLDLMKQKYLKNKSYKKVFQDLKDLEDYRTNYLDVLFNKFSNIPENLLIKMQTICISNWRSELTLTEWEYLDKWETPKFSEYKSKVETLIELDYSNTK